ncbi:MAG: DNA helicase RecQ [Planctomycetota bacterium]|nr:DNA helicase RecQ [Planctomycetaceae bacterium]MDQ3331713.1 DNA helicase RecQ [Planctomycetota bacterium]
MLVDISTDRLLSVLREHWGYESFRPLQVEAIRHVTDRRDSVVVLPTGGGKSLCYQVPAVCSGRLAVVVSPLISLMKDQVDSLRACGVAASCVNSSLTSDERREVADDARAGRLRLLYVAPERLVTDRMLDFLADVDVAFFAIDEAHCISQWGHDFRPEYRRLSVLKERFADVGVHAFTATATERVRRDIADQLGLEEPAILVGDFDRPNLTYRVQRRTERFKQIEAVVDRHPQESGIVYCISRREVDETATALREKGLKAVAYHAGLSDIERHRNQDAFLEDKAQVVVATVAFGMGIDKSNVRYVVHLGMPKSLEHYQQEAGRAGRDGLEAECILFYSGSDIALWKRMLNESEPEARAAAEASLDEIARYCAGATCRHRTLVEHFDQPFEKGECGDACDVCLGEVDLVPDALILAQKIASCVVRIGQRYGAEYAAMVLTGSNDAKIVQSGHHRVSTFGLLKHEPKKAVRDWIDQLLGQGYLRKSGDYGVLQVTPQGHLLLKGNASPKLLRPAPEKSKRRRPSAIDEGWAGVDRELFESLRTLRAEFAEERNVPPYVVFNDATLRDLARQKPSSRDAFLEIRGVGQTKADVFGPRFLVCIRQHLGNEHAKEEVSQAATPPVPVNGLSAGALASFPLFRTGISVEEVAARLDRSVSTVQRYLVDYLRAERVMDPTPWVDQATADRIHEAASAVGTDMLRPIRERLGEDVSYGAIRVVVECLRNEEEEKDDSLQKID